MVIKNPLIRKTFSLLIYVAVAVAVAFLIVDRHPPTLAVDSIAPIDEKLILISGTSTTFKRLLRKPMVINFWASYCPPCLKELPAFGMIAKKYQGKIGFLGVAVATDKESILQIKNRFLLDYDMAVISDEAVEKWHARALPTTYIVDSKGKVLWARAGVVTEEDLEKAIRMVF